MARASIYRALEVLSDLNLIVRVDVGAGAAPWNDQRQPAEARVEALIGEMTLREKVAQLYGVWVGAPDSGDDAGRVDTRPEKWGDTTAPATTASAMRSASCSYASSFCPTRSFA